MSCLTLRRTPAATPPNATDEAVEATATLAQADLDTVADALCLAGCARHRTWLVQFLRALGRRTSSDTFFGTADVTAALHALRIDGRVIDVEGIGFDLPAARRLERLPALLLTVVAAQTHADRHGLRRFLQQLAPTGTGPSGGVEQ